MQSIVILISGGGSNMAALVRAAQQEDWASRYGAAVAAVISNRSDAAGLRWAQEQGIATQTIAHKDFPDRTPSRPTPVVLSRRWSCWPALCAS